MATKSQREAQLESVLRRVRSELETQEQGALDQEYFRNHPWERGGNIMVGDMFGALNNPDPEELQARLVRERQYDRTQAEAEIQARTAPGQFAPSWENPGQMQELKAPGMRAWETPESVEDDVNLKWGLLSPGERDWRAPMVRTAGNSVFERDQDGNWNTVAEAPKSSNERQTAWERNSALYLQQVQEAESATTSEDQERWMELANATKSWLEKQGKFAPPPPPKSPVQSTTQSVRSIVNPAYRYNTKASPFLSLTNQSSRLTGPAGTSPFDIGLQMGSTNSPSNATGLQEGQRVRNKRTGKMGTVKNGVVVPDS